MEKKHVKKRKNRESEVNKRKILIVGVMKGTESSRIQNNSLFSL